MSEITYPVNACGQRVVDFTGLPYSLNFFVDPMKGYVDSRYTDVPKALRPESVPICLKDFIPVGFDLYLGFAKGDFDWYCAYLAKKMPNGKWMCACARDGFYFSCLLRVAEYFSSDSLLADAKFIYGSVGTPENPSPKLKVTSKWNPYAVQPDPDMLNWIRMRAAYYQTRAITCESLYKYAMTHIYFGMIAEVKKVSSKCGALIKLLGIDDILNKNVSVRDATSRTCGVDCQLIFKECAERGLY